MFDRNKDGFIDRSELKRVANMVELDYLNITMELKYFSSWELCLARRKSRTSCLKLMW